jgi:hypothetical protein
MFIAITLFTFILFAIIMLANGIDILDAKNDIFSTKD